MAVITVFDGSDLKELDTTKKSFPEPQPIDRAEVKEIQSRAITERVHALTAVSPGYSEMPIKAIEYVGLHLGSSGRASPRSKR